MVRAFLFLVVLGFLSWAAYVLEEPPGSVTMHWRGYRVDTSFGVLVGAVAAIAVVAALLYQLWLFLRGLPARIGRLRRDRRRRGGYLALTRGMVAVAAGDAEEARRQGKRAEGLLNDPPLTMLLSAQAAQLAGDEGAAEKFFKAMLDRPETEFLGLRGLLTQGVKRRRWNEALTLARRAYRLKPDSAWVAGNLFDLQVRAGQWTDAELTFAESIRDGRVPAGLATRRRAVLLYQRALEAAARGEANDSAKLIHRANGLDPGFVPAAVRLARLLAAEGKGRKAATVIENAWVRQPHPHLFEAYREARPAADGLEAVRAIKRLVRSSPDHRESLVALARAALEARLWGEAGRHLAAVTGDHPPVRVCRLMAELAEGEHGDAERAREWLVRASLAEPDPAWVCDHCGNVTETWAALCGNCGSFDSFAWKTPPRVAGPAVLGPEDLKPSALPAAEGAPD